MEQRFGGHLVTSPAAVSDGLLVVQGVRSTHFVAGPGKRRACCRRPVDERQTPIRKRKQTLPVVKSWEVSRGPCEPEVAALPTSPTE